MPNIRDLGISSIPATARPLEVGNGGGGGSEPPLPTSPPLCGCDPTSHYDKDDKDDVGGEPGYGDCHPTHEPDYGEGDCHPTSRGENEENDDDHGPDGGPNDRKNDKNTKSAIPPDAVAQLKSQLHQHISTQV